MVPIATHTMDVNTVETFVEVKAEQDISPGMRVPSPPSSFRHQGMRARTFTLKRGARPRTAPDATRLSVGAGRHKIRATALGQLGADPLQAACPAVTCSPAIVSEAHIGCIRFQSS